MPCGLAKSEGSVGRRKEAPGLDEVVLSACYDMAEALDVFRRGYQSTLANFLETRYRMRPRSYR